jgi:small ligand-binding sensory domain FIST
VPVKAFAVAHAAAPTAREAAASCAATLAGAVRGANLGFVYASDEFADDLGDVLSVLGNATGVGHWVGSVGVGISATGIEYHERPALAIMTAAFPEGTYRVFSGVEGDLSGFQRDHGEWVRATGCRFGVVHGDPRNPSLPGLIVEFSRALNDGFLVGGLTSTRTRYAHIADGVTGGGLSGVLFSPEVAVATNLTQSCLPFGSTHEITECKRNIVVSLDNRPALDVFSEEIGEILSRDLQQAARYIGAALPVPGSDTGDYVVRNLVGFDPGSRLLAIGDLLVPGQAVRFCKRDPVSARRDLERMLDDLRGRVAGAPRGALYYSCVGRGRHMFGDQSEELGTIQHAFGDLPMTGFFCNGEISFNRLYGYTGVLTLFL